MNYGKAIKIVRAAHGLTQLQLSERLSISASHLSLIEARKRQPSLEVLEEVAGVFNLPPHLLTLLASDPEDIKKSGDGKQVAELAGSLLELLISSGNQPTLPMKARKSGAQSRVG